MGRWENGTSNQDIIVDPNEESMSEVVEILNGMVGSRRNNETFSLTKKSIACRSGSLKCTSFAESAPSSVDPQDG